MSRPWVGRWVDLTACPLGAAAVAGNGWRGAQIGIGVGLSGCEAMVLRNAASEQASTVPE
jgi:hypothetical protein